MACFGLKSKPWMKLAIKPAHSNFISTVFFAKLYRLEKFLQTLNKLLWERNLKPYQMIGTRRTAKVSLGKRFGRMPSISLFAAITFTLSDKYRETLSDWKYNSGPQLLVDLKLVPTGKIKFFAEQIAKLLAVAVIACWKTWLHFKNR